MSLTPEERENLKKGYSAQPFEKDGKWYFWDETEAYYYPIDGCANEDEALLARDIYAKNLIQTEKENSVE